MRLLFITDVRFWRCSMGSQVRIDKMISRMLLKGDSVDVFFVGSLYSEDIKILNKFTPAYSLHSAGIHTTSTEPIPLSIYRQLIRPTLIFIRGIIRQVRLEFSRNLERRRGNKIQYFRKFSLQIKEMKLADFINTRTEQRFSALCKEINPDAVVVEYVRLAWLLKSCKHNVPQHCISFIDTHDVQYDRQSSFHRQGWPHDIDITPKEEATALNTADYVIAIQGKDRQKLGALLAVDKVIVVGLAPPLQQPPNLIRTTRKTVYLGFVGSTMQPNVMAAKRLIQKIFRPLRETFGAIIELRVFGKVCGEIAEFSGEPGVSMLGYVEQMADAFSAIDIFVNPVTSGGGLKIKNVEALSFGKLMLTTDIGAEGLEAGAGSAFVLAQTDQEFIATLAHLLATPEQWPSLQRLAWEFSQQYGNDTAIYHEFDQALKPVRLKALEVGTRVTWKNAESPTLNLG